jgi:hypothetical protein
LPELAPGRLPADRIMTPVRAPGGVTAAEGGQDRCGSPDEEDLTMLLVLLRTRLKALVFTLLLSLAAPRVARWLRGFGERRRRAGGSTLSYRVPLGAADVLDRAALWARPPKERRRWARRR